MAFEPLDGAWKPAASADLRVPNVLDSVTPNPNSHLSKIRNVL